ncbi:MAG TPA: hypothetical protein VLV86_08705 [Vicinamibacterales bacterium]|nr:hypothetical protein [Vicinamibacterales bacterium]
MMRRCTLIVTAAVLLVCGPSLVCAEDPESPDTTTTTVEPAAPNRLLGVLPNNLTVDQTTVSPQTTRQAFKATSLNTFDPVIFPMVGVMTIFGGGQSSNYATRYSRTFADNTIGNFMTGAIVPSLADEDSRYYRRGTGGLFSRVAYAASRSVVTRTRGGSAIFNISEIGGTAAAASLSNFYYSPADRTVNATLTRWGTQVMWDTLSNELKEFWPDVRAKIHGH